MPVGLLGSSSDCSDFSRRLYFVAKSRGYRAALELGDTPKKWWAEEGRPKLAKEITADMARQGKSPAEIRARVSSLETWSQDSIEAQYYAEHRKISRGNGVYVEDEVFHKLEKLELKEVLIHEIDANGIEVGTPFWHEFLTARLNPAWPVAREMPYGRSSGRRKSSDKFFQVLRHAKKRRKKSPLEPRLLIQRKAKPRIRSEVGVTLCAGR